MAEDIYTKYNIDKTKLKRDYIKNPLKLIPLIKGSYKKEIPIKEDIIYLSEIPLTNTEIGIFFSVGEKTIRKWKKELNIKNNWKKIRLRQQQTYYKINNRHIYKDNILKSKNTKKKLYNNENYNNREKAKNTCLKKYGVNWFLQSKKYKKYFNNKEWIKDINQKRYLTHIKNNSFGISKIENDIKCLLNKKFMFVIQQYKSSEYPFRCDFYIPEIDTYIEYQGYFTHGKEPYIGTNEQKEIVKLWESKNTPQYTNAIKTWTVRDPLKRETAKKNNLNYLEFFNITQFMEWYNKQ